MAPITALYQVVRDDLRTLCAAIEEGFHVYSRARSRASSKGLVLLPPRLQKALLETLRSLPALERSQVTRSGIVTVAVGLGERALPACAQRFVWIFTELIDWSGGDDPQTWTILPLTDDEAMRFASVLDLAPLAALARTRDYLRIHHPKSGPTIAGYRRGPLLGHHD